MYSVFSNIEWEILWMHIFNRNLSFLYSIFHWSVYKSIERKGDRGLFPAKVRIEKAYLRKYTEVHFCQVEEKGKGSWRVRLLPEEIGWFGIHTYTKFYKGEHRSCRRIPPCLPQGLQPYCLHVLCQSHPPQDPPPSLRVSPSQYFPRGSAIP